MKPAGEQGLSDQQKAYLQGLEDQRAGLIKRFEATPQSIANKHLRWRVAADIEQLKWRIGYLTKGESNEGKDGLDEIMD